MLLLEINFILSYLPGNCGINSRWQIRRGRHCLVPRVSHQASSTVQTIRYGSFAVRGPMLFNTLPSELRNMTNCSSESFKQALDTFLKTITDEPQTPGYTYMRRADSNSLIHITPLATARHPSISEDLDNMPQARGTHGHLGPEPGNHRQVDLSTSKQERVSSRLLAMTAVLSVDTFLGKRLYLK